MQFVVDGERTRGVELVEELLASGQTEDLHLTREVAEQAIDAFESLEMPWLVSEIIESGEQFGKQVHSVATRGLLEVVQNADDQGAENIRLGFRQRGRKSELLVAHDGNPVEIIDVMRMAMPLLSGSRRDPKKIGRFGIGLKTLNQLGERLAVHCPPIPGFEISNGQISRVRSLGAIRGFWDPGSRETLFALDLSQGRFDLAFFKRWIDDWDASSLLFLRNLRSVSFANLSPGARSKAVRREIEIGSPRSLPLEMPRYSSATQVSVKEARGGRAWVRYTVEHPVPKRVKATNKELGSTVLLQIAIPRHGGANRIAVGLPLEEPCHLPYSFSAPFDPNGERTRLRDNNSLNEWLIERIGDFATAISLDRFARQPKSAWSTVPLEDDEAGDSDWAKERFRRMLSRHRSRVSKRVRLRLPDGTEVRLADLTYEPEEFEGLIDAGSLDRIWTETSSSWGERRVVPKSWRDRGRWRQLLRELEGPAPLHPDECLSMLDWPDSELPADLSRWLVKMVAAGLSAGEQDVLREKACVALAGDGDRLSPDGIAEGGILLVHSVGKGGLASSLGLETQIARPFKARSETAESVRSWLAGLGVLRERASDQDALRALARADLVEPIDLRRRDNVLLKIRNAFEGFPAEEKEGIGPGIGHNIGLVGHRFERGKQVATLARLDRAYLSSAIEKNFGWPTAAGQTPGLIWIDRRYSVLLRSKMKGRGALSFLKALGAAVAPRLEPGPAPTSNPSARPYARSKSLSAQHAEEFRGMTKATGLRDDWVSPDLEAVVGDMLKDRTVRGKRKRAEALLAALDRNWEESYSQKASAMAVHHYHSWHSDGEVSPTWLANLASAHWLSTREDRYRRAAPRELTVLTEAAFDFEGADTAKYAHEIEADFVDSPVVEALHIQGRPRASSILERIESFRAAEQSGEKISQAWVDRCYRALNSYVPSGPYQDRSDLTGAQVKRAFSKAGGGMGLIRSGDRWLAPSEARRGPRLDESVGWVSSEADALWSFLNVQEPSVADCLAVLETLSKKSESDARPGEILTFRRLCELSSQERMRKSSLAGIWLRSHSRAPRNKRDGLFAVANETVAKALGETWPVWNPPLPLEELAPLLPYLGIETLDESNLSSKIPGHLAADVIGLQDDFTAALGHLQDYLPVRHPTLLKRIRPSKWRELHSAKLIVGRDWRIQVSAKGRKATTLTVPAYLFREPLVFCAADEYEISAPDSGGAAIAAFCLDDDVVGAEERSTLALAWAYAYSIRDRVREDLSFLTPGDEPEDAPPPEEFHKFRRKGRSRHTPRKPGKRERRSERPPRKLVDIEELELDRIEASFYEAERRTALKVPPKTAPSKRRDRSARSRRSPAERAANPGYTATDREDLAFEIVSEVLHGSHGLDLEDVRSEGGMGADGVDREKDIWVEIKAHVGGVPERFRFPRSEAKRSAEKRGRYWLAIVWGLESKPELAIVPDPLHRLDTFIGDGVQLTGFADLAKKSKR